MHVVLFMRYKLKFSSFHDSCGVIGKKINFRNSQNTLRKMSNAINYFGPHIFTPISSFFENFCYMRLGHHHISTNVSYMPPSGIQMKITSVVIIFSSCVTMSKMYLALAVGHLPGCEMAGTSLSVPTSNSASCSAVKHPCGILQK